MAKLSIPQNAVATNNIQTKPDIVIGDAANLKQAFDQYGIDEKNYNNNTLIPALNDDDGSKRIGHNSPNIGSNNVADALEELQSNIVSVVAGSIPDNSITDAKLSNTAGQVKPRLATLEGTVSTLSTNVSTVTTDLSNFEDDFEYPVATIVSRQIQIPKLGTNKVSRFKLDTAIPSGASITISLDGGATSLPLKDIEEASVLELEKGFYEVIADATFFTLRPSGTSKKGNYLASLTCGDYMRNIGGTVRNFDQDDDYLYMSQGADNDFVRKSDKLELKSITTSPTSYGSTILTVDSKSEFVFVAGGATPRITKLNKSTLAVVASLTPSGIGTVRRVYTDGIYLYVMGDTKNNLMRYLISNLTFVDESPTFSFAAAGYHMVIDGGFAYCLRGLSGSQVDKVDLSNMSIVATYSGDGQTGQGIVKKGDFIYVSSNGGVNKVNASTMALAVSGPTPVATGGAGITEFNNSIYMGSFVSESAVDGFTNSTNIKLHSFNSTTLEIELKGVDSYATGIISDSDYIYGIHARSLTASRSIHKIKPIKA